MKKNNIFAFLLSVVMILMVSMTGCSRSESPSGSSAPSSGGGATAGSSSSVAESSSQGQSSSTGTSKILVAYFSQTGNTRTLAKQIHDQAGGEIFEIVPVKPYTSDYNTLVNQAKKEIDSDYKPELKTKVENLESYDVIFVGSPCWWGAIAPPVKTFLSGNDFSGKTIIPFDTNEGSGMGNIIADIKKICPKATVQETGLAVRGSDAGNAKNTVTDWLKKIGIAK